MPLDAAPSSARVLPALSLVAVVNVTLLGPAICQEVEDATLATSLRKLC